MPLSFEPFIMTFSRKTGLQFKKPTGFYGRIISRLMISGNKHAYNTLIPLLNINSKDKILEIGYGPGVGINMIARQYDTDEIYGLDYSGLMLKSASERNSQHIRNGRVHLMLGDFLEAEIPSIDFDKIFCLNVIYFWDDLEKPFKRVYSLLKKGGAFCIFMQKSDNLEKAKFTKDDIFNKYSIGQVFAALEYAGFKEISHKFSKGYYILTKK